MDLFMIDNIKANFTGSIQTKILASEVPREPIDIAANIIVEELICGNKILNGANGWCSSDAKHCS